MQYILILDTEDTIVPYMLVTSDYRYQSSWKTTPEHLFKRKLRAVTPNSFVDELPIVDDPKIIRYPITLDEFSYTEFASKYPEHLL